eukprot:2987479-Rhodomonas_salina.1
MEPAGGRRHRAKPPRPLAGRSGGGTQRKRQGSQAPPPHRRSSASGAEPGVGKRWGALDALARACRRWAGAAKGSTLSTLDAARLVRASSLTHTPHPAPRTPHPAPRIAQCESQHRAFRIRHALNHSKLHFAEGRDRAMLALWSPQRSGVHSSGVEGDPLEHAQPSSTVHSDEHPSPARQPLTVGVCKRRRR